MTAGWSSSHQAQHLAQTDWPQWHAQLSYCPWLSRKPDYNKYSPRAPSKCLHIPKFLNNHLHSNISYESYRVYAKWVRSVFAEDQQSTCHSSVPYHKNQHVSDHPQEYRCQSCIPPQSTPIYAQSENQHILGPSPCTFPDPPLSHLYSHSLPVLPFTSLIDPLAT